MNSIKTYPTKQIKEKSEDCKIKIKKTSQGKEIQFSGKCTKDQVDLARGNLEGD